MSYLVNISISYQSSGSILTSTNTYFLLWSFIIGMTYHRVRQVMHSFKAAPKKNIFRPNVKLKGMYFHIGSFRGDYLVTCNCYNLDHGGCHGVSTVCVNADLQ